MIEIGKILIVDDSAMMRMVLRKSLTMAKVESGEIVEATNGSEAMQCLQSQHFDILFCDLNMPGMSGDELIAKLKLLDSVEVPPIVIVSAEATPERVARLQCDRVVGVLRKPFLPESIAKLVADSKTICVKELSK
jgi:two-component system, chemotaxis family, chemotaxis protein CheY